MINFNSVELAGEPSLFVMPAAESHYLTRRMRAAGVELVYHSWREVVRGEAPLGYDECMDALRPFEEAGSFSATPCIIESRVRACDMLERAMLMYAAPIDADFKIYSKSHAQLDELVTEKPKRGCVMGVKSIRDQARDYDSLPFDKGDDELPVKVLRRRSRLDGRFSCLPETEDVLLAEQIVGDIAEGRMFETMMSIDPYDESLSGRAPIGVSQNSQLRGVFSMRSTDYYRRESEDMRNSYGSFADEDQALFMLEEAIATSAVEIAAWVNSGRRAEHPTEGVFAYLYCEVDPANFPRFAAMLEFEGVVGNPSRGFVRHMRTSSVRVKLARRKRVARGFEARFVSPDFESPFAECTGADLRQEARKLQRELGYITFGGEIMEAVREYRCGAESTLPVEIRDYDLCGDGGDYYAVVNVPGGNPAVSQRVYLMEYGTYFVSCSGDVPDHVKYFPWIQVGGPGVGSDSVSVEFLTESDGPHAHLFDASVRLEDPGVFAAFAATHPEVAAVVDDLRRTADWYRRKLHEGHEDAGAPGHEYSPWRDVEISLEGSGQVQEQGPFVARHNDSIPLDCPEGTSAFRAIASGRV